MNAQLQLGQPQTSWPSLGQALFSGSCFLPTKLSVYSYQPDTVEQPHATSTMIFLVWANGMNNKYNKIPKLCNGFKYYHQTIFALNFFCVG